MSQLDLLQGKSRLDISIALLRHWEPEEGYYLAFSGGKDSIVLHRLAEMAGVKFDAHYSVTTIDPPEVCRFMRTEYPTVRWEHPAHTFYWHVARRGVPTRRNRWCCDELKEGGGRGRAIILTGVRAEESPSRAKRGQVETCRRTGGRMLHPIRDWTETEVWEFIHAEKLPHPSLYGEGWHRIGCVCCPFENRVAKSIARWPRIWENVRRALHKMWADKLGEDREIYKRFTGPDDLYDWWCSRDRPYPPRFPQFREAERRFDEELDEWVDYDEQGELPGLFV